MRFIGCKLRMEGKDMKQALVLAGIVLMFGGFSSGYAMRCQQNLVYEGDSKYIVLKKCGEPLAKDMYENPEILFSEYDVPYTDIGNVYEVWTYQRSSNEFLYEVLFENGRVKSISANRSNF
ncbi:hypothetical protein Lspi_0797 [Legionella spiritensis]|uniref:DUF2845 domain-containing protein n=2 Tax=Legionella spiritensis TaxID=452 RepID=A0A0W0Z775_LEGSP|nr:hypothetical protein Lspi_0797 [Legionella spiritensis]SNV47503.1 Protein of uncharacterised function (DUF2845) [Legionella spiritensis]